MFKNQNKNQNCRLSSNSTNTNFKTKLSDHNKEIIDMYLKDVINKVLKNNGSTSLAMFDSLKDCTSSLQANWESDKLICTLIGSLNENTLKLQNRFNEVTEQVDKISKLFNEALMGEYSFFYNYFRRRKFHEDSSNIDEKRIVELTLSSLLSSLVRYVKKAIKQFILYLIEIGPFYNARIISKKSIDNLINICVRDTLEPLIPLLIGSFLMEVNFQNINDLDLSLITYCKDVRKYTIKRYRKILTTLDFFKRLIKHGTQPDWDLFFNCVIFSGHENMVRDKRFIKTVWAFTDFQVTPSMINYNFKFINNVMVDVISSRLRGFTGKDSLVLILPNGKSKG